MEDLLSLVAELQQLADSELEAQAPQEGLPGDRWLLRSAIQKAVRRGQTESAQQLAHKFLRVDSDYLWRSLAVIAVEDVGFGDADMITFTTAANSKTVRKAVGNDYGLLDALVHRMCAAPKSRACCELSIAVDMGRPDLIPAMARRSDLELVQALEARNSGTVYTALGVIRGKFPGHPARPTIPRQLVEEIMLDRLAMNPKAARAAVHAFRRPVDTMSLAVMPVTRLMLDQDQVELVGEAGSWPLSVSIGGFRAETYDLHTRAGVTALRTFYTTMRRRYGWLAAVHPQAAARAVGSALFLEEGGLVDRRITSPALSILQERQDVALMSSYGVPERHHEALRRLVSSEIAAVHTARRAATTVA